MLGWAGESLDQASEVSKAFVEGIGGPGQYYLYRPDLHVGFILEFARKLKLLAPDGRREVLSDHRRLRELVDQDVPDGAVSMRHVLLHLLEPEAYERIASDGHKRAIASTFAGFLPPDPLEDIDERLLLIRGRSAELLASEVPPDQLDFYRPPLQGVWGASGADGVPELEAVEIKKQIVLYGPPGRARRTKRRSWLPSRSHPCRPLVGRIHLFRAPGRAPEARSRYFGFDACSFIPRTHTRNSSAACGFVRADHIRERLPA